MLFNITLSDESLLDLREAHDYYSAISDTLMHRFNVDIDDAIERIAINPENFQKRYRNIKIVFTKTFPFGIHYLVEQDSVYILRILHQKQLYK